ncbi:MAG: DUF350 domain-containing protein [Gammaproteobacteria bacterium]|nr:DUF350 domain-containing protein [Gammaproteobacteria bacterium]
MNYVVLHDASFLYYFIDLVIVLMVLGGIRFFSGTLASTSLTDTVSKEDNFAMGISMAGALIGVSIMLMGAVAGEAGTDPVHEIILMFSYGFAGLALMWLTHQVFDYISLPEISVKEQLHKDNVAVGLVDAGNMIATAIILRALMSWVEGNSLIGLLALLGGYIVSQIILYLATRYRATVFSHHYPDRTLAQEIADGNLALAVRFTGHRIGVALAVTASSGIVVYNAGDLTTSLLAWSGIALLMFLIQTIVSLVARFIILPGINISEEVVDQRNVAIGALEAAIYIAVGLIFVGLFG